LSAILLCVYPAVYPGPAVPPPAEASGPDAAPPAADAAVVPERASVPDTAPVVTAPAPAADHAAATVEAKAQNHQDAGPDPIDEDVALFGTSGDPFGDGAKAAVLSFRLLMQARFADEWTQTQPRDNSIEVYRDIANATENDGWRMNRLFLRAIAKPRKWIQGRLLLDFAELRWGSRRGTVKLAYVVVKPLPRTRLTVGLFKRPYSLLELLPIAEFEFADVGPTDDVIKELGFGGRDVGAMVQVEPLPVKRWLNVSAGVYGGDAEGRFASFAGLVAARAESRALRFVRLGTDVSWRPRRTQAYVEDTVDYRGVDFLDRGAAVSGDVTLNLGHLQLRGEGLYGKRVDMRSRLNDGSGFYVGDCPSGQCHWIAGWALAAYRVPIGKRSVLMPAVRAEWLEMNREQHSGKRTFLTGALNCDVTPELRVLVDVTWRRVQPQSLALEQLNEFITLGSTIYDLGGTRMTLQAQLSI
jgi:hypothetical protein